MVAIEYYVIYFGLQINEGSTATALGRIDTSPILFN